MRGLCAEHGLHEPRRPPARRDFLSSFVHPVHIERGLRGLRRYVLQQRRGLPVTAILRGRARAALSAVYCRATFTTRSKIAGVNTLPRSCAATRSKMPFHSAFSASVSS
jgi:hypothetical protein